jgi:hypothetical protein
MALETTIDPADGCVMYTLEKITDIALLPADEIPKALAVLPTFIFSYKAILLAAEAEGIPVESLGLKPMKWKVDGLSNVQLRSADDEMLMEVLVNG